MEKKDIIPKLKKNINSFIKDEHGKISKQSLVSIGAFISAVVASSLLSTKDIEAGNVELEVYGDNVSIANVTATHSHHFSHSTHSTHSSSDKTLKQGIRLIENPLEKIQHISGVTFQWKDTNQSDTGLIAQNVELVFPELVVTDKATGLKSLKYANLAAPLIEAVKEQQRQIEELKSEITNIKKIGMLNYQ